jgi:hypothetical protein
MPILERIVARLASDTLNAHLEHNLNLMVIHEDVLRNLESIFGEQRFIAGVPVYGPMTQDQGNIMEEIENVTDQIVRIRGDVQNTLDSIRNLELVVANRNAVARLTAATETASKRVRF